MTDHPLEHALRIALEAHAGQKDHGGTPYILHVLTVVLGSQPDLDAMTVAALHDVVEDTPVTLEHLRAQGFPDRILEAVDAMTRREGEAYDDYVGRVVANPLSRRVKKADLEHNMDVRRLPEVTTDDLSHLQRYRRAWERVTRPENPGRA